MRFKLFIGLGFIALIVCFSLGLAAGSFVLSPIELFKALNDPEAVLYKVIVQHRLPRVILSISGGAVLALSGLSFQTVLRNPLAEPYILGISGGAAVGAILSVLLGFPYLYRSLGAFLGSLVVLALVLLISRQRSDSLILAGVMLNAFCGAIILFFISLARPDEIGTIMFWFMGNLGGPDLNTALAYALFFLPGILLLLFFGHSMNLLMLGRDTAQSLSMPVDRLVLLILLVCSLMVSALTAAVGPLGFVGLIVPQALRLIIGHDSKKLLISSAIWGGVFLCLCDTLARSLPSQGEMPSGVITALIGAPFFIFLLRRQR